MAEHKFFRCKHCGNFIGLINNAGVPMICCGEKMEEIIPNTTEASTEKHIPKVTRTGDILTVQVGDVIHPSTEEHHIEFVYVQTVNGGQRKSIEVGKDPIVKFAIVEDEPVEVFAYCNIHGLWKVTI